MWGGRVEGEVCIARRERDTMFVHNIVAGNDVVAKTRCDIGGRGETW